MRNLIRILRSLGVTTILLISVFFGDAQSTGSKSSLKDTNESFSADASVSAEESKVGNRMEIYSKGFIQEAGKRNKDAMDMSIGTDQVFSAGNRPGLVKSYQSGHAIFYQSAVVLILICEQTGYWPVNTPI